MYQFLTEPTGVLNTAELLINESRPNARDQPW